MLGGRTSPRLIPAPMDIALTHRLSFKQASLTVLVAFILGTLLSLIQVGVDYASQDASINREVRALLDVSHNPAARIAYNIDAGWPRKLVLGLLRSPAVVRAEIIDTSGLPLASASREPAESRLRPLSDFLFGHKRVYEDPLHVDHAPGEALGVLHLEIDTFVFGNDFLRRAGITLLSGFVRSLLLSLILLVLFYTLLTKPLVSLIQALSGHDPRSPARMRLPCPKGHERDEIGVLVEVINRQLGRISVEIEQRREAENRLTQYLEELESIVAARTAELKAANARLTLSNQELEEARQTALDMAQARASFLANMSHEIRTPLNGLLGMLSLSLDGPLTPEQRQQLSIAHDSGKVLVELLNDVLDLSKFEAGQLVLEQIPFDLGVLVEDTASLLSQNAAAGVELTCLVDPALPAQVSGDPTRIRQVVSNLLSNALKFTRLGRVDVRVEATAEGVRISVRDTGIGIAQEALDRIFQPFTQADAGITRQYGGTGLGLALTRKLCEAMQGELTVESTVGLGSLFSVGLPLAPVSPPLQALPLRGRVIAQCSANSGLAQLLQTWLPRWGLEYKRLETDDSLLGHSLDVLISDCPDCLMGLRPSIGTPILLVTAYGSFLEPEPGPPPVAAAPTGQAAESQPVVPGPETRARTHCHSPVERLGHHGRTAQHPGPAGGGQPGQPVGRQGPAAQARLPGMDRRTRAECPEDAGGASHRPGPDGLQHASDGRLRSDPADPRQRTLGRPADHRADRQRPAGRARTLSCRRHGRLPGQAFPPRRTESHPRPLVPAHRERLAGLATTASLLPPDGSATAIRPGAGAGRTSR